MDRPVTTVIYLEDSEDEVFLARRVVRRLGLAVALHHFATFEELADALAGGLAPVASESIIVLDLNLKLCSGIDVLRALRAIDETRHVLTGFCSGSEDPADRRDAMEAGADFFIAKPLFPSGLERLCAAVDTLRWEPAIGDGHPIRRHDPIPLARAG